MDHTSTTAQPSAKQHLKTEVLKALQGKTTIQQITGLADNQIEAIYGVGYALYESGKLNDAIQVFAWLCVNNPFKAKYWLGLGASLQMKKMHGEAFRAYTMAAVNDEDDPTACLHAAECCLALGLKKDARTVLQMAIESGKGNDAYTSIHSRAQALLSSLDDKIGDKIGDKNSQNKNG